MNEIYETVYDHVSGEDYCTATATERWSKNMFNKLKEKYPNTVYVGRPTKWGNKFVVGEKMNVWGLWITLTPKSAVWWFR